MLSKIVWEISFFIRHVFWFGGVALKCLLFDEDCGKESHNDRVKRIEKDMRKGYYNE